MEQDPGDRGTRGRMERLWMRMGGSQAGLAPSTQQALGRSPVLSLCLFSLLSSVGFWPFLLGASQLCGVSPVLHWPPPFSPPPFSAVELSPLRVPQACGEGSPGPAVPGLPSSPPCTEDFRVMSHLFSSCPWSRASGDFKAQRRPLTCPGYSGRGLESQQQPASELRLC